MDVSGKQSFNIPDSRLLLNFQLKHQLPGECVLVGPLNLCACCAVDVLDGLLADDDQNRLRQLNQLARYAAGSSSRKRQLRELDVEDRLWSAVRRSKNTDPQTLSHMVQIYQSWSMSAFAVS